MWLGSAQLPWACFLCASTWEAHANTWLPRNSSSASRCVHRIPRESRISSHEPRSLFKSVDIAVLTWSVTSSVCFELLSQVVTLVSCMNCVFLYSVTPCVAHSLVFEWSFWSASNSSTATQQNLCTIRDSDLSCEVFVYWLRSNLDKIRVPQSSFPRNQCSNCPWV